MRMPKGLWVLWVLLLGLATLAAKEKWDSTPYEQWTRAEALDVFEKSAWVQLQDYSSPMGATQGQNEAHHFFTVRLFSALPVRQAYVQIMRLMNNYASLTGERRQQLDAMTSEFLSPNYDKYVVVSVAYKSNIPEASRDMVRFLNTSTKNTLNQNAFLFTSRSGRLDLIDYVPPGQHGMGARFVFPRTFKGESVFQPGDKEIRFEFWVDPIGQELRVGWKGSKLMYKDALAY